MTGPPLRKETYAQLERLNELRGQIVGGYALVEFLMADLAMRCRSRWPEYTFLSKSLPYRLSTKLDRLRRAFTIEGPLQAYKAEVLDLLPRLERYSELRHMLAHGLVRASMQRDGPAKLHLRRFEQDGSDPVQLEASSDMTQMEKVAVELNIFTGVAYKLFERIYAEHGLDEAGVSPVEIIRSSPLTSGA